MSDENNTDFKSKCKSRTGLQQRLRVKCGGRYPRFRKIDIVAK